MSPQTNLNQTLAESTYDQESGRRTIGDRTRSAAEGPKDTATGTIEETPEAPGDRPGTDTEGHR